MSLFHFPLQSIAAFARHAVTMCFVLALLLSTSLTLAQEFDAPIQSPPPVSAVPEHDHVAGAPHRTPVGPAIFYSGYYFNTESAFDRDEGGGFKADEYLLRFPLFILGKDRDFFVTGSARYEYTDLTFSEFEMIPSTDVHAARLRATAYWEPKNSPWFAQVRLEPGLYTDGSDIDGDDYQSRGLAALGYKFSPTFRILAGGYYTESYGDASVYPAVGLIWNPSDHFTLHLAPPEPRLSYYPTRDWGLHVKVAPGGGSWNLDSETSDVVDQLIYTNFRAGIGIERRIYKNFWASLWGGSNIFQSLEFHDKRERTLFDEDLDTSYYLYLGFHLAAW
jgi:hypothetical protein